MSTAEKQTASAQLARLHLQLDALRAELEQRNAYLGQLSHQLRTPLMAIMGYGSLISPADSQSHAQLSQMLHAAETVLSVLRDVPSAPIHPTSPSLQPCTPSQLMSELKGCFSFEAERKNLRFHMQWDDEIPAMLWCDLPRLRQVLMVLVHNAIKFTESGGVTVYVSLQQANAAQVTLEYVVEDSGIGMSEAKLASLFNPPPHSAAPRFGRAGKSLLHAHDWVQSMGSTLHAASQPGEGSRFHFLLTLPRYQGAEAAGSSANAPLSADNGIWAQARVLVVDDHAMNRELLQSMLLRLGVGHADIAADGEEALRHAQAVAYDLIIMDCQMPVMDGFEATRRLRDSVTGSATPVIGITADVMRADIAKCFAAGMDDYRHKPLDLAELEQLLHRWLSPQQA